MRRWGWLVAVPLTPVVLVGVALTVSIFGAIFGIPLLLLAGRPWWACLAVALGRNQPANWSRYLRVHLGVCLAVAAATVVVTGALGLDDLEDWTDLSFWVLIAVMLSTAVYGGIRLLRSR